MQDVQLTPHFKLSEFRCPCLCGWEQRPDVKANLAHLCITILEPLRVETGAALTVNSGARCPAHNKAVGGAKNSFHVKGQAADVVSHKFKPRDLVAFALDKLRNAVGGYHAYVTKGFSHLDTGPRRTWEG